MPPERGAPDPLVHLADTNLAHNARWRIADKS
jgi:hypothetical protein